VASQPDKKIFEQNCFVLKWYVRRDIANVRRKNRPVRIV